MNQCKNKLQKLRTRWVTAAILILIPQFCITNWQDTKINGECDLANL